MTTPTVQETRARLARHLAWHPNSGDCLQCAAARLAETFPDTLPESVDRPALDDLLDVAERAAKELDDVIDHLDGEHGATLRDALNSIAVTTDSGALTAILARAACGPDPAEAALDAATRRLDRIRVLHIQLVDEHSNQWGPLRLVNCRADMIRRLAQAWHGHLPADPHAPLTRDH
ncbi:hypothetical protein [Actinomadura sp. WMMA1423]|uniref:hypothetical protein n=1 Tax=Actinomadura sp. WMMA1423 TaxID=2591108 RepID=UPI001146562F|nr:hypothetical protein [Actinomadura sp. WMMA1423]